MTDCKNCKYTDEYCASGDCTSQSPRNHLATTSQVSDLTEQMHKGELPEGWYYVIKTGDVAMLEYCCNCFLDGDVPLIDNEVTEVLAPVPSYEEWKALKASYEMSNDANLKQATWMVDMEKENAQLKDLLKEVYVAINEGSYFDQCDILKKIDEVQDE